MAVPLEGIRVLEFCRWQQGPHCGVLLADMGAEVIKVEMPGVGDPGRSLWPSADGYCAYFEAHNRGKKSITLDLHKPQAVEVACRLAATADVVVENFRRGFMDRTGLGYDRLRAINPRLIYASASGFGPQGPWRERLSFDLIGQGMGGIMMAQRESYEDEPRPALGGTADQAASIVLAYGVVMALLARERYGVGQQVDSSLLGTQLALQSYNVTHSLYNERQVISNPKRRHPTFTTYQAGDGRWFTLGAMDARYWPRLCQAIDRHDLMEDPRFADPKARIDNAEELRALLEEVFRQRRRDEWVETFAQHEVPAGPVYEYAEVAQSPQVWANGYLTEVEHPRFGQVQMVGIPVHLGETPGRVPGPAPELGQHTEEILRSLRYSVEEIQQLREESVI
ncbi:MAG: CaiB/BaiF CoA transferase family protein [Dehalococcoidia bacterium]